MQLNYLGNYFTICDNFYSSISSSQPVPSEWQVTVHHELGLLVRLSETELSSAVALFIKAFPTVAPNLDVTRWLRKLVLKWKVN